ncbi:hypothetical protein JCGZ_04185 [Jatropha curcas]|uniref:Dolichyl-diphosphooligosaccharide--protein glycosyltransferase 48 kDa subunit n=1 Tax=Jatropha curcas TaxID=180498 RepID=A0A067L5R5_JATCU|nr:hypothetical protein JCGZ_04185 [Jatropha curcas]
MRVSFGGSMDLPAILDFVDFGRDFIIAVDVNASVLIREIAIESGVDFDEDLRALVIDHMSDAVLETEGDHTLNATTGLGAPVLFQGIAHTLNPTSSLVLKVLSAFPSAYSADPKAKLLNSPLLPGSAISLVSIVQV